MHEVRPASMAYFDLEGTVEVEVTCLYTEIDCVNIAPASRGSLTNIMEIPFCLS